MPLARVTNLWGELTVAGVPHRVYPYETSTASGHGHTNGGEAKRNNAKRQKVGMSAETNPQGTRKSCRTATSYKGGYFGTEARGLGAGGWAIDRAARDKAPRHAAGNNVRVCNIGTAWLACGP